MCDWTAQLVLQAEVHVLVSWEGSMKIVTEQHYSDEWTAVDDDTYDGPGSPIGYGKTDIEAIDDLMEKLGIVYVTVKGPVR